MDATDSATLLQARLRPGEKLLWVGRPAPQALARRTLLHFIASTCGLFILVALAVGPMRGPLTTGENLIGDPAEARLMFALVALFFGVFFVVSAHRYIANWTHHYALTSCRVMIFDALWPTRLKSYGYGAFRNMTRSGDDARGTIEFGTPTAPLIQFQLIKGYTIKLRPQLAGLSEPAKVEALIRDKIAEMSNP